MINYIRKNTETYKNNVMKNKSSKCSFLASKKIWCSLNFLKWPLAIQDAKHLVDAKCLFVVPLTIQDQKHIVAIRLFFFPLGDLMATRSSLVD
jgi:hypothetical protein